MAKTCDVCGSPSGMYPICRACFKLKDEGKVIKCSNCGKWHYGDRPCICDMGKTTIHNIEKKVTSEEVRSIPNARVIARDVAPMNETRHCYICDESSDIFPQCKDCFEETLEYLKSFDKNMDTHQINEYYYNLKSNIYRMVGENAIQTNCNKLIALALLNKQVNSNNALCDKVYSDVKEIIEKKLPRVKDIPTTPTNIKNDEQKSSLITTIDGHKVDSIGEELIDNALYNIRAVHAIHVAVFGIPKEEQSLNADFFIPIKGNATGIYIEYWGMRTKEYLRNKERKLKQYKEHKIPLINIEQDEYKGDSAGIQNRLFSDINSLAKEFYGITNYLKP